MSNGQKLIPSSGRTTGYLIGKLLCKLFSARLMFSLVGSKFSGAGLLLRIVPLTWIIPADRILTKL